MPNVVKMEKKVKCDFCGKEATLLCDMLKASIVTSVDFKRHVLTCGKNICIECATKVGEFDYCPDCVKAIKMASRK